MDDVSNNRANSVNRDSRCSDGDIHDPEEDHPGLPHGVDRCEQVSIAHQEATAKLKTLVQEMTALLQAHGLPIDSYTCGAHYILTVAAQNIVGPLEHVCWVRKGYLLGS